MNNKNLLNKIHYSIDIGTGNNLDLHQKAKLNNSGVERGDNFVIFKRRTGKDKRPSYPRFNEAIRYRGKGRRALSCVGVQKLKIEHPQQEVVTPKIIDPRRTCFTPNNQRAHSICAKDEVKSLNKTVVPSQVVSRAVTPVASRMSYIVRSSNKNHKPVILEDKHSEDPLVSKDELLKTVEEKIRDKYADDASNQQKLKRFKQLQEYLKMAHREVKITNNAKNETRRIVKGEIPLGTDTQIKYGSRKFCGTREIARINEIKRRLKNCLSINYDFDEVIKYAKDFYGLNEDDTIVQNIIESKEFQKAREYNNFVDPKPVESKLDLKDKIAERDQESEGEGDGEAEAEPDTKTNISFVSKKWNNIDELIDVLKEELEEQA